MNVYWSIDHKEAVGALRGHTPEPVLKNKRIQEVEYHACPAFRDYYHNVYGVSSLYTYSLELDGQQFKTDLYNQDFYDNNVMVRSVEHKLLSIKQRITFITDSPSLKMSQEHQSFEDNKFTESCYTISGIIDIGKYYRNLDFAFHLKDAHNKVEFSEGDIIYYLRFHTDEKINFKQYFINDKLREYRDMIDDIRMFSPIHNRPLNFFYDIFKRNNLKDKIIKEIKENLVHD